LQAAEHRLTSFAKDSKVGFSLRHFTGTAHGVFTDYSGSLDFDDRAPENSRVSFEVNVGSIDTDNSKRDEHLRGTEYFNAQRYPTMTFASQKFKPVGKNKFMVTGPLRIKGHEKMVSVPVVLERKQTLWASGEESLHFSGSLEIDRTEFGVGEESALLGSQVTIELDLEFRGGR
jgi:polyisoprenoid-binding protein YceI